MPRARSIRLPVLAFLVLLTAILPCRADDFIRLSLQVDTRFNGTEIQVEVQIRNLGTSPALDIRPALELPDRMMKLPRRARLNPGSTYRETLSIEARSVNAIAFAPLHVLYRDATASRGAAVALARFNTPASEDFPLNILLAPVELGRGCTALTAQVHNRGTTARQVVLSLFVPQTLGVEVPQESIDIGPGERHTLDGRLCRVAPGTGGTLPLFLSAVEAQEGKVNAVLAKTTIHVDPRSLVARFFANKMVVFALVWLFITVLVLSMALSLKDRFEPANRQPRTPR